MTETVGLKLLLTFKDEFVKIAKSFKQDFLQAFNNGLSEYITNYYEKYSKTKTFIYRDERVDFYDVFFPLTLESSVTKQIDITKDLKNLFSDKRFITIIGSAGSGKSMLTKHLFLAAVNQTVRIPIVVELRKLNDYEGNLFEYIKSILIQTEIAISDSFVDKILKQKNFLFLFDGYDEIYSAHKAKITHEVEEFVDKYNKNTYVITSRPGANVESLQRFDNYYVKPLTKEQIINFVELQFKNHENKDSLERILAIIDKPDNTDFKEYLHNPLLLSMFVFTFNSYPEIPKYKSRFYWNVFDTLCTKHDSFSKNGFWLHERKSGLLNDDLENILKWLSYLTLFHGHLNFEEDFLKETIDSITEKLCITAGSKEIIYDLTVSIGILIEDGTEYTFPHKSLQEYFTAVLIKGLKEREKEKVYTSKFENLLKLSNGGNLNFFKLCYELDKEAFSKYFLIPTANKYLLSLDQNNDETITRTSLEYFGIILTIANIGTSDGNFYIAAYSYNNSTVDSALTFFTELGHYPGDFEELDDHLYMIEDWIYKRLKNKKNGTVSVNFKRDWNDEIYNFTIKSGLTEHYKAMAKQISDNLSKIQTEVDKETTSITDLLDI